MKFKIGSSKFLIKFFLDLIKTGATIIIHMATKELKQMNRVAGRTANMKIIAPVSISEDGEGQVKKSFEKEMLKLSRRKAVFEYSGKGSLVKKIV